jgi:hypothetical protein
LRKRKCRERWTKRQSPHIKSVTSFSEIGVFEGWEKQCGNDQIAIREYVQQRSKQK